MNLIPYIKAKYPILYIVTPEEARAEVVICNAATALQRRVRFWSFTDGFFALNKDYKPERIEDPIDALSRVKGNGEPGKELENDIIFVMRDLHAFFGEPKVVRKMRDIASTFKQVNKTLIVVSPTRRIPPELERDITVLQFELPRREEITAIFKNLYSAGVQTKLGKVTDDELERVIQAALGLTTIEAENAFAKAIVETSTVDKNARQPLSRLVLTEKANAVKKNGLLEYFHTSQSPHDIGGLDNLKEWLTMRSRAFSRKARDFGLPMPRGILLAGLPGCGKSLSAKAASVVLGVPLIRFDIGKVFGGLVGQSEENMRMALQTAEAIGSCALWLDELEKALSGISGNGSTDGGTSQRVFGNFITWLQEKTAACFVVATVNRIAGLPPELLRKGRFDEIFFVGLPSPSERAAILKIHIRKYRRDPGTFAEKVIKRCIEASEGFSGAEIEEGVVSALYTAFHHDREITAEDILAALQRTNPLSKSRADELKAMAEWAQNNAVNASKIDPSTPENPAQAGRQLDI